MTRPAALPCLLLAASLASAASAQQDDSEALAPNTLVVATVKLQGGETLYAQPGQALVVVSADAQNVLVKAPDGDKNLRVPRRAVVPIQEAGPVYDRLIRSTPTDANLFLARANVFTARGETVKAIADIQQALKLDPQLEAAYVSLAEAQMQEQQYDQVLRTVAKALTLDPENPTYYVLRGVALRRQEKLDEAVQAFNEALKRAPEHVPAISSRGFIHYLQGRHQQAVEDFDKWVQLEPDSAMAVNNRGYNRQLTGDFAGALKDYDQALQLSPQFALAHQNKAWLLAACPDQKLRDGKAAYDSASQACVIRNYNVPEDLKALAAAYAELGDFQHAVEYQQKVVDAKEGEDKAAEEKILATYKMNKPYRFQLP